MPRLSCKDRRSDVFNHAKKNVQAKVSRYLSYAWIQYVCMFAGTRLSRKGTFASVDLGGDNRTGLSLKRQLIDSQSLAQGTTGHSRQKTVTVAERTPYTKPSVIQLFSIMQQQPCPLHFASASTATIVAADRNRHRQEARRQIPVRALSRRQFLR